MYCWCCTWKCQSTRILPRTSPGQLYAILPVWPAITYSTQTLVRTAKNTRNKNDSQNQHCSMFNLTKSWLMWNAVQFKTGVTGVKIRMRTLSISKLVLGFLLAAMLDFYITGYYIFLCWSTSFCSKFVCWPKTIWPFVYFTIVGWKILLSSNEDTFHTCGLRRDKIMQSRWNSYKWMDTIVDQSNCDGQALCWRQRYCAWLIPWKLELV